MDLFSRNAELPDLDQAPAGRAEPLPVSGTHFVNGNPMIEPFPEGMQKAIFGLGCFWGAEKWFWELPGVYSTAAGYTAGTTPNPTYQEVCTGLTSHNEVVLLVFDPMACSYEQLLKVFWEAHDPTQGMRQGNDVGTQYRSGIYTFSPDQQQAAENSRMIFQESLQVSGYGNITTEIQAADNFYYAEDCHQQYLAKNPAGYCGLGGTGVCMPA